MKTALIYHPDYLKHDTGHHPESPKRLVVIMEGLKAGGLLERVYMPEPREVDPELVGLVHDREHIRQVERACRDGITHLDPDTAICPDSYRVALLAVGGVIEAVDAVMSGRSPNGLVLPRPPGHHATRHRAMGFCLFNNIAVGARYLTSEYSLSRVAIVDIDVHHGNGTQDIFYDDPSVLYISMHQYPHYPGSGSTDETGTGAARGTTVNLPLPAGSGDAEYLEAWETTGPKSLQDFGPEFVLVSLGFDGYRHDPLSYMDLSSDGFRAIAGSIIDTAADCCGGRLISVLEGGYSLKTIPSLVADHLELLITAGSRSHTGSEELNPVREGE